MKNVNLNNFVEEIVNAVNEGLMVVDEDGIIKMVNQGFESITGYSKDELIGESCEILNCDVCEMSRFESKEKWCMLFELGYVQLKRCLMMKKDGSYVSVFKTATVLKGESGVPVGAVETFVDISEIDKKDQKIEELSNLLNKDNGFYGMVGRSEAIQKIYHIVEKAAQSDAPVIITGESGTGKELVAQAIHDIGRRKEGPFVKFNCAALHADLSESELFGHTKGAFTGAYRHRMGRFETAHNGDIFLDEIGDLPTSIQAKLLRVIESKKFERVGDNHSICVDVRIITATNKNLTEMISQGKFREDLFFRINVVPIHLPPLRERNSDIPLLVDHFIQELRLKSQKNIFSVHRHVMSLFMKYQWPGNIRELKSCLEYAFVVAPSGVIHLSHLPAGLQDAENTIHRSVPFSSDSGFRGSEKDSLVEALRITNGNKHQAAKILGVHRMTVWNRMRKYGIELKKEIQG